ncbi:MAG: hypothetical protein ABII06_16005, partial [Pseudomonadota bacterium]
MNPVNPMKRFFLVCIFSFMALSARGAAAYTMEDCVQCHEGEGKAFIGSAHAGETTCLDCHRDVKDDTHEKTKGSGAVDCGQCHDQKNRHGSRSVNGIRPQCHTCHTRHRILDKQNGASSVHSGRLKKTCGACHAVQSGEVDFLSRLTTLHVASHKKQDFSRSYERTDCIGCHQGAAA